MPTSQPYQREGAPKFANSWRCDTCGRPIEDGHGFLAFRNTHSGGLPDWSDRDEREFNAQFRAAESALTAHNGKAISLAELAKLPQRPARCRIAAYHRRCDQLPDEQAVWVPVERCRDLDLLDWIGHLLTKPWFGAEEAQELIHRYRQGVTAGPSHAQTVRADQSAAV